MIALSPPRFGIIPNRFFLEFSPLSINDIIDFLMLIESPLVNFVRLGTITYSIWMIWRVRNHAKFQENISICSAIQTIKGFIKMMGNSSRKHMRNDIVDFTYLKFFYITTRRQKEISPIQVIWEFPYITDSAARGCPGFSACVGIFRGSSGEYIVSFSSFLGVQKSLYVEVMGVILAIEFAWSKGFRCIWLECDSSLLCQAFSLFNLIPWSLRGRWRKCIKICKEIEFEVSHIFRERNHYADKLALLGLDNKLDFKWYDDLPIIIKLNFFHFNSLCFVLFSLVKEYFPSFLAMGLA